jgi:hypothetical protein
VDWVAAKFEAVAPVTYVVAVIVGREGAREDPERLGVVSGVVLELCLLRHPEELRRHFAEPLNHVFPHTVVHNLQPYAMKK